MIHDSANLPQPHDLLWGFAPQYLHEAVPQWARQAVAEQVPVVVRRAKSGPGWLAVGIRGHQREQRLAAWMRVQDVSRRVSPEQISAAEAWQQLAQPQWPVFSALMYLAPLLQARGLCWGVTGSLGFELASGIGAVHAQSDLDLLVRTPQRMSRAWARELSVVLNSATGSVDMQLETPCGGLALREWAGTAPRVLVKTNSGPILTADPWATVQVPA